jgi:RHS repeat-associated protein
VGNRTYDNNTVIAVTTSRVQGYDLASNRLMNITENAAALRSYTYDVGGNIITDVRPGESFAFTYNKRNRPISVTRNAVAYATYGYNALEQLVTRVTSAAGGPVGTIHYIYDLDGHLIAEADAITGATTREYIWAAANDNTPIDLPLAVIDGVNTATPATLWVHTYHLGRPTRMTDSTKATVWQAAYKAWGEPTILTGTKLLNLRFPGQYFQIETGLAYNWNRHYDTTTGRYTQPDPLRFVDGPSVYAYAGNSPWMETDRDGRIIDTAADVVFVLYDVWKIWNDGDCNRGENIAALGLDLAAVLIPGVTGLGAASRVGLRGGETVATKLGRAKYLELREKILKKPGWQSEPRIYTGNGSYIKPDVVTPRGRIIEMKPNTFSGRAEGRRQAKRYGDATQKKVRVIYYDP